MKSDWGMQVRWPLDHVAPLRLRSRQADNRLGGKC